MTSISQQPETHLTGPAGRGATSSLKRRSIWRNALLATAALATAVTLASCSGGGPSTQAPSKSEQANPATVVDGMHYVQLFNTVDPVLARLQATGKSIVPPTATELKGAVSSLRAFAAQAKTLPTDDHGRAALTRLSQAASALAYQLNTMAAAPSLSPDARSHLNGALAEFHSAALAARQVTGLPTVAVTTPHTGSSSK
jgi:hypothetical protein